MLTFSRFQSFACGAACCLGLFVAGCGGGQDAAPWAREVQPASGKILLAGEPVTDIVVTFHSAGGNSLPGSGVKVLSRGQTLSDGTFAVSTYEANDGLPVGEYQLSFSYLGPLEGLSEDEIDKLRERLNRKYLNPQTSGVSYTIVEGENEIPVIELTK